MESGWSRPVFLPRNPPLEEVESICRAAWLGLKRGDTRVDSTNRPNTLLRLGKASPELIAAALRLLEARHPVLASRLDERDGAPWIVPAAPVRLSQLEIACDPGESERQAAERAIGDAVWRPFDIARGPLCRAFAFRLRTGEGWAGLVVHHFVADAASIGLLVEDFRAICRSLMSGSGPLPVALTYQDYLATMGEWIASDAGRTARARVAERLSAIPRLEFGARDASVSEEFFSFDSDVSARIRVTARVLRVTPYTLLVAAQKLALRGFSPDGRVVLKIITGGRELSSLVRTVGNLADRQFIVTDLNGNPTFEEAVRRTHDALALGRKSAFVRSDFVLADLASRGLPSEAPVFNFRSRSPPAGPQGVLGASKDAPLRVPPSGGERTLPRDAYYLDMVDTGEDFCGSIRYGAGRIDGFLARLEAILRAGSAEPGLPSPELLRRAGSDSSTGLCQQGKAAQPAA